MHGKVFMASTCQVTINPLPQHMTMPADMLICMLHHSAQPPLFFHVNVESTSHETKLKEECDGAKSLIRSFDKIGPSEMLHACEGKTRWCLACMLWQLSSGVQSVVQTHMRKTQLMDAGKNTNVFLVWAECWLGEAVDFCA